ncbi:hypothetical protein [Streptomyces sp. NPDC051561]|uniref:hypothetical protein n=1 Tax=Streptomyces sp. NPDC051561 TaxID=3365658 RepID=UPI0037B49ABD
MQQTQEQAARDRPQPPAPVWTPVPPPERQGEAGTPIYDALVAVWQQRGRQLPRPAAAFGAEGAGSAGVPAAVSGALVPVTHRSGWWAERPDPHAPR